MPYAYTVIQRSSLTGLQRKFGDFRTIRNYQDALAELIAHEFLIRTGEVLEPGKQTLVFEPSWGDTAPVSLVITITVWWNEQRHGRFAGIERALEEAVRSWDVVFSDATVVVNEIGAWHAREPMRNRHAMPLWDLFYEGHTGIGDPDLVTWRRLDQAGIKTVGQLIRFSPYELGQRAQIRWSGQRNLRKYLRHFDLALRPNNLGTHHVTQIIPDPLDPPPSTESQRL